MNDAEAQGHAALVVPCFNEAARLNVEAFRAFLDSDPRVRILFVDDGSTDATPGVIQNVRRGFESRALMLPLDRNRGKAEAVRSGVETLLAGSREPVVGFWDADLATPLTAFSQLLTVLERDPQIQMVFGSRVKLLGRHVERRATRHYLGRVFATVVSSMLRLPIYDTQCGAKLFRVTPDLRAVFAQPFVSKWIFDVEILARFLNRYNHDVKRLERAIYEYPLEEWVDVAGSKVGPTDFLTALIDLVRIRARYRP